MDRRRTASSSRASTTSASTTPSLFEPDIEPPNVAFDPDAEDGDAGGGGNGEPEVGPSGLTYEEEKAREIAMYDLNKEHKQHYRGTLLLWVAFQSTGVIYGEIGTSPLYVFSSTFFRQPSWHDLTGALSIIIWSLTLIVTIKYCFIVLRADDDGQGGTFALYSLLSRYTQIIKSDPRIGGMIKMRRYPTDELRPGARTVRRALETSKTIQFALKVVGVVGVSFVMAEAVLMPAQSVLGAIQGIRVADPDLGTPAVIGTSCALLIVLFLIQPFGTAKLGTLFAPIVCIWMLFNLSTGIYNLATYDHTVLKAFNPYYAFAYLQRNGYEGWKSLGGLLLAFTGVEALFADLGAFSMRAVQISWLALAFPCLLFTYAGQAAFISRDETGIAYTNPFFYTVPPGTFYFGLVIAVLASLVASQAMITSTFQLLAQVMKMSYFPHIKVVHTSKRFHDQVYMPLANWLLMIGTVIVTAVYNNTTSLGQAYGVCVILVTFITTCLVGLVAILIWHVPIFIVLPIFLLFAALDGAFMTAVLTKVPDGAWFTLVLAFIISSIFILWRFGKEVQWSVESLDRLSANDLFATEDDDNDNNTVCPSTTAAATGISTTTSPTELRNRQTTTTTTLSTTHQPRLAPAFGSHPISTVPGLGIFFDKIGDPSILPISFVHFVRKFAARPTVLIFFHMRSIPVPFVDESERFVVTATRTLPDVNQIEREREEEMERQNEEDLDRRGRSQIRAADIVAAMRRGEIDEYGHRISPAGDDDITAMDAGGVASSETERAARRRQLQLLPNCYNVVLRHGYADEPTPPGLAEELVQQIELAIVRAARNEESTLRALEAVKEATRSQTVYVLGKETLRVKRADDGDGDGEEGDRRKGSVGGDGDEEGRRDSVTKTIRRWSPWGMGRRVLLHSFLWIRDNSRTKLAEVSIDMDSVVEVGFLKEIS